MKLRLHAIAGALLSLAVGCAHVPAANAPPAEARWTELESAHFVMRTDLPPHDARAALAEFERTYVAFESYLFRSQPARQRIDLVLFRDEQAFRAVAPAGASGYFLPHQYNEVAAAPTIAMHGGLSEVMRRRFQHELTHRFLDQRVRAAPTWLEEGLAEFYSTAQLDGNEIELGRIPNRELFRLDIHLLGSLAERWEERRVAMDEVPGVRELFSADYETFHTPGRDFAYYAASWTLVHMLQNGPYGYRRRFVRYLDGLSAGQPNELAWRSAFGDVDVDMLERQFRRYLLRPEMDRRSERFRLTSSAKPERQRTLKPFEVHLLLARVRPWDHRENIFNAGDELRQARALAPREGTPELHYWIALYAERWRRFDVAARELYLALQTAPDDERYQLALAELLTRWDRTPVSDGIVRPVVSRLEHMARTAETLDFLARYYGARGEAERGLPFARRAVEIDPDCWDCVDTLQKLHQQQQARMSPSERPQLLPVHSYL